MKDALRLSRGMSHKNAMASPPMGGGKAVVLLDQDRTRTPAMLAAFGDAIEAFGGRYVTAEGARLTLADIDTARAEALAQELGATAVDASAIMEVPCDVFSPNALGAILDAQSVARLACRIVAGGANNQIATPEDGVALAKRGILYAPDYVINVGRIINVSLEYLARQ